MRIIKVFIILILAIGCSDDAIEPKLSPENKVLTFSIMVDNETFIGKIDHHSKVIKIETTGLEQNDLIVPEMSISEKALIFPSVTTSQNFNDHVEYMITAENGEQVIYTVDIINQPYSDEKSILSFKLLIDGETFEGEIDENSKTITVISSKDFSNVAPDIQVSDFATVSPANNEKQDFNYEIEFVVTAQNGSTSSYNVKVYKREINVSYKSCYIRATSFGRVNFIDLTQNEYDLVLENSTNSYSLDYFDVDTWGDEIIQSNFYFTIQEEIATAGDYVLKFKLDGKTIASTPYYIDVLAENAPKFTSLSQDSYSRNDVLVINGENITDAITIPSNGSLFIIKNSNQYDYTVNSDKTQAALILDYYYLFPSYFGREAAEKTITFMGPDGRFGESFTTIFN